MPSIAALTLRDGSGYQSLVPAGAGGGLSPPPFSPVCAVLVCREGHLGGGRSWCSGGYLFYEFCFNGTFQTQWRHRTATHRPPPSAAASSAGPASALPAPPPQTASQTTVQTLRFVSLNDRLSCHCVVLFYMTISTPEDMSRFLSIAIKQRHPGRQSPERAAAELSEAGAPGMPGVSQAQPRPPPQPPSSTGRRGGGATLILVPPCFDLQATTSTNWILESQNINELKSEINSLKGLLLNR